MNLLDWEQKTPPTILREEQQEEQEELQHCNRRCRVELKPPAVQLRLEGGHCSFSPPPYDCLMLLLFHLLTLLALSPCSCWKQLLSFHWTNRNPRRRKGAGPQQEDQRNTRLCLCERETFILI